MPQTDLYLHPPCKMVLQLLWGNFVIVKSEIVFCFKRRWETCCYGGVKRKESPHSFCTVVMVRVTVWEDVCTGSSSVSGGACRLQLTEPPEGKEWMKSVRCDHREAAAHGSCSPYSSVPPLRLRWKEGSGRPPAERGKGVMRKKKETQALMSSEW